MDTVQIPPLPPAVEPLPQVIKHITEMSEEEREAVLGECHLARESYERCKRNGEFNCKRDRCKEACEKKEKEEKERRTMLDTLTERNKVLETWARDSEAKTRKMEERMEKMASLISQLIPK